MQIDDLNLRKIKVYIFIMMIIVFCGTWYSPRKEDFKESSSQLEEYKEAEVYVCGAVLTPGIYKLSKEDRIIDAVSAAGGFLESADKDDINLAEHVTDSQKVYVPFKGNNITNEVEEVHVDYIIDINKDSINKLVLLPGIGETIASRIIDYREKTGGFKTIEEIKNVKGIGDAVFNKIKDSIKI